MARSTQAQRAERVRAAQELLARGTSMAEAVVALSRDFGLSRRQAYRYLEEAQATVPPLAVTAGSVTITLKIPSALGEELRAYAASRGLSLSETVRRAIANYLSAARGHG
jgi:predicted DNA-binding transcriptional regulator YafY